MKAEASISLPDTGSDVSMMLVLSELPPIHFC